MSRDVRVGRAACVALALLASCTHGRPRMAVVHEQAAQDIAANLADGPGGPILIITRKGAEQFGAFYAEILRAEGLNAFRALDLGALTPAVLDDFDIALLAETSGAPLSAPEAALLADFVKRGHGLIAMKPEAALAEVLGLALAPVMGSVAYFKVDTARAPGTGVAAETLQFHGEAVRFAVRSGTRTVAELCETATACTAGPALTLREGIGPGGGRAAAFAFDVARSVVLTRQGNPQLQGRDVDGDGMVRAEDMFRAGWLDMDKVHIPQADELQRLLVNLILTMNADRRPLPRFWYLPGGRPVALLMAGDDHNAQGTKRSFNALQAPPYSPTGCSVADWTCARSTGLLFHRVALSPAEQSAWAAAGFELGTHMARVENDSACYNGTRAEWAQAYGDRLAEFGAKYPRVPPQTTTRVHCLAAEDWDRHALLAAARHMRVDMNYYYWPPAWANGRSGYMTGSGLPMRFARLSDHALVDVYQAPTHYTYESFPAPAGGDAVAHHRALIDAWIADAITSGNGPIIGTHYDYSAASNPMEQALRESALAHHVAMVSGRQVAEWLDRRNAASFEEIAWANGTLTFRVAAPAGSTGLTGMVPLQTAVGPLRQLALDGVPTSFEARTVGGLGYGFFDAAAGSYEAVYRP